MKIMTMPRVLAFQSGDNDVIISTAATTPSAGPATTAPSTTAS